MNNYTEENQKAEFIGGAIAGGCGLIMISFVVILGLIGLIGALAGD
jgi:hypothetical protein